MTLKNRPLNLHPDELGIDPKNAAKIEEIKRLRPLSPYQPWGVFFVKFEPKKLPVVALRRILGSVVLKEPGVSESRGVQGVGGRRSAFHLQLRWEWRGSQDHLCPLCPRSGPYGVANSEGLRMGQPRYVAAYRSRRKDFYAATCGGPLTNRTRKGGEPSGRAHLLFDIKRRSGPRER